MMEQDTIMSEEQLPILNDGTNDAIMSGGTTARFRWWNKWHKNVGGTTAHFGILDDETNYTIMSEERLTVLDDETNDTIMSFFRQFKALL